MASAARLGDRKALGQLVSVLQPRMISHARRLLGDPEEAADAVQMAWVDVIGGLGSLRDVNAVRPFALRIVGRKVARIIRGRVNRRSLAQAWEREPPGGSEPLGEMAADAVRVRRAIDALPKEQRATLALFYLEDLSVAEVAKVLGVPMGTVKTRLMHARAKLHDTLKGTANDKD